MAASLENPRKTPGKLSPNHQAVFDALKGADRPMTAYDLIDVLRPQGITAPPTVYRGLNKLIDLGLAHRIESLNAFVACCDAHGHDGPVVFTICEDCGDAAEFTDDGLTAMLTKRAQGQDFKVERALLELRGQCGACEDRKTGDEPL